MKKTIIAIFLFIFIINENANSQVGVSVNFNTFYTDLSPYGRWIDYPQYGRVWIYNGQGFRPYFDDGHWVYTDYGWTWVSDYPWGWAPFHYGRWAYLPDYGWVWVPGYEWAPAWVSWCDGDGYYGWAPLSPGLSIDVSFSSIPAERWCFVQHQYINSPSLHQHFIDPKRSTDIYRNVSFINNIKAAHNARYVAGPKREDVERVTHQRIQSRTISYSQRPGRTTVKNNTINLYRPSTGANKNQHTPNNNLKNKTRVNNAHRSVQHQQIHQSQVHQRQHQAQQRQQTQQRQIEQNQQRQHQMQEHQQAQQRQSEQNQQRQHQVQQQHQQIQHQRVEQNQQMQHQQVEQRQEEQHQPQHEPHH